ncbi:glycoside hydrolase family 3 protein [Treponema zioleckii]|uniref:glycoside hydrolase family 3 protein n=1 Tax=Treponema zioleckii TaxID=331680 RepID=UPI00168B3595|nr:glycoside hydrolase family 3 protein [Treponema zioleckii]
MQEKTNSAEEERAIAEAIKASKIEEAKNEAIKNFVGSLSPDEKFAQLFLVNIEGNEKFRSVENTKDKKPLVPGGCLLFFPNISDNAEKTFQFIKSIKDFYVQNNLVPPYIATDQEGGDVVRLRKVTSKFLSQKEIAQNALKTDQAVCEYYETQAKQMALIGFNMNLAPVVEVETDFNHDFLDTRTFGNLENVLKYGKIEIDGFEKNGIATVLKHFPGNSSTDPHTGLPSITYSDSEKEIYFKPFEELLKSSSAVLMSHAIVKPYGSQEKIYDSPACLSYHWVTQIVREKYGFDGLIFSDDIFMGALTDNGFPPEKAAIEAINAGINVIMLSEKKFGTVSEILQAEASKNEVFRKKIEKSVFRIIEYKIKTGILKFEEISKDSSNEDFKLKFIVKINEDFSKEFDKKQFSNAYEKGMNLINHETER